MTLDKLQPEDITQGFCIQHSISSADACREQLQLGSAGQAGEIWQHTNVLIGLSALNFVMYLPSVIYIYIYIYIMNLRDEEEQTDCENYYIYLILYS